ncbi:hypothetical protein ACFL57_00695 [Candidatus Margulisiibacteriota bacterium]
MSNKNNNSENTKAGLYEFKSIISDIFGFGIDSGLDTNNPFQQKMRSEFYESIYHERENGIEEFQRAITSGNNVVILTGHVGVGKSTYIKHKLEHIKNCTGIMIDINQYADRISDSDNKGQELRKIIGESLKKCILYNFIYHNALNDIDGEIESRKDGELIRLEDITHNLNKTPPVQKIGSVEHEKAYINIASYILLRSDYMDNDKIRKIRAKYGGDLRLEGDDKKRFLVFKGKIADSNNYMEAYDEIFDAIQYEDWVTIYQILFQPSKPTIIVLDNTDSLDIRNLPEDFFNSTVEISHEINKWHDTAIALGLNMNPVKIIFAVRDENIALLRVKNREAAPAIQIALGLDDREIDFIKHKDVPTTPQFVSHVIRKRYNYFSRLNNVNKILKLYFRTILNYWFQTKVEKSNLTDIISGVDIYNLNNSSIRMILEHLELACMDVLSKAIRSNISIERLSEQHATIWLKGRMVKTTWAHRSIPNLRSQMKNDISRESDVPYLSYLRLILTRIVNNKGKRHDNIETPKTLLCSMQNYFKKLEMEKLKKILCMLYEGQICQGELISIRQAAIIDTLKKGEDIDDDAEITAMPRGEEILSKILIHIDYYGEMLSESQKGSIMRKSRKILAEMLPEEAYLYASSIFNSIISKMSVNYSEIWKSTICPNIKSEFTKSGETRFFDAFKEDKYIYKKEFYITRVCDSHLYSLKQYVFEALKGNESKLFLSPEEMAKLDKMAQDIKNNFWDDTTSKEWENIKTAVSLHPDDTTLQRLTNCVNDDNPIKKIWKLCDEYKKIITKFHLEKECLDVEKERV